MNERVSKVNEDDVREIMDMIYLSGIKNEDEIIKKLNRLIEGNIIKDPKTKKRSFLEAIAHGIASKFWGGTYIYAKPPIAPRLSYSGKKAGRTNPKTTPRLAEK